MDSQDKPPDQYEQVRRPFHVYSSFNKKDGKTHPLVIRRRNRALAMWAELRTVDEIAEELDIHADTVRFYIRRARRLNDPRALRPTGWEKRVMMARIRKVNIHKMSEAGLNPREIASRLGVHPRLVQMRLKEIKEGR